MIWIITSPERIHEENSIVQELLEAGADTILLRKPGTGTMAHREWLDRIDPVYYPRIMISGETALCQQYSLQGVHYSEKVRMSLPGGLPPAMLTDRYRVSAAIHTPAAIPVLGLHWHALLLSPVFNSISKPGYPGKHSCTRPDTSGIHAMVLALGGIDHHNISRLYEQGFHGAALMGAIWQSPAKAVDNFYRIRQAWTAATTMLPWK